MNNLFNHQDVSEIIGRIEKLTPATQRQWGKMNVAQMLAHCNASIETAMGLNNLPRVFAGRLIAPFIRKIVLSEKPFGKNSPTAKSYIFPAHLDFNEQKAKAKISIKTFSEGGASRCTTHPHPFFGKFTPEEWAIFQWKHLDHHLRQFGV
ncbi:MAG: DUF1569 domain-containing protein [Sphingobacteriales bacterium]